MTCQLIDLRCLNAIIPRLFLTIILPNSLKRRQGRSKGFAHVDFQNPELATRAVTELNGMELLGRSLRIDLAQRKEDRPAGSDGMREVSNTRALPPNSFVRLLLTK
jgi:RNA recognition motif-containing protein